MGKHHEDSDQKPLISKNALTIDLEMLMQEANIGDARVAAVIANEVTRSLEKQGYDIMF